MPIPPRRSLAENERDAQRGQPRFVLKIGSYFMLVTTTLPQQKAHERLKQAVGTADSNGNIVYLRHELDIAALEEAIVAALASQ